MLYYTKNDLKEILYILVEMLEINTMALLDKKKAWDDHSSNAWMKIFFIDNKNINKLKFVLNCVAASDGDSLLFK